VFELARKEAIFVGRHRGLRAGARRVAERAGPDLDRDVVPGLGERYLSKLNPDWLKEKGLLEDGMF
jgi:hypothetical protein